MKPNAVRGAPQGFAALLQVVLPGRDEDIDGLEIHFPDLCAVFDVRGQNNHLAFLERTVGTEFVDVGLFRILEVIFLYIEF
jgi:hypothetical protein